MLDAKIVGQVIQRVREKNGMSQELVSGLAGIGRTHLSAIERGERKPTLETFYRIALAMNLHPWKLMRLIEEEMERGCLTNGVRQPRKYSARLLKRVGRWRIIKV